jgi:hypothetical protein
VVLVIELVPVLLLSSPLRLSVSLRCLALLVKRGDPRFEVLLEYVVRVPLQCADRLALLFGQLVLSSGELREFIGGLLRLSRQLILQKRIVLLLSVDQD